MPKTDAEWQALDEQLAREVMGLHIFVPISGGREWRDNSGVSHYGVIDHGHSHSKLPRWQPHEDVAQALGVLDVVVRRGFDADLRIRYHDPKHQAWIRPADFCFGVCMGRHTGRANAICLAIEKWANAQKEEQDV